MTHSSNNIDNINEINKNAKNKTRNKTLLITGAAKRIGSEVVKHFAKLGYDVIFTYNSSDDDSKNLIKVCEKINSNQNSNNNNITAYKLDLFNVDEINKFLKFLEKLNILPNIIINNASIFEKSTAEHFDIKNFDNNFNLHVKAPIIISSFFYNLAKQLGKKCSVINICDSNVVRKKTKYFNYLLSKKALLDASYFMASEFAPFVRVNCILPGYIIGAASEDKSYLASLETKIPMLQKGSADDIIKAIEYLAYNDYITGQAIAVDGGLNLVGL